MAPALKPATLQNATDAAAIQKLMKADLKSRSGKRGVKFVAAKNCRIGSKTISLFIVTDTPALYEAVIKTQFPNAYHAKGVCDVLKGLKSTFQVMIRSSSGQITPNTIADLVRPAVGSEKSIMASFEPSPTPTGLKPVTAPDRPGVPDWAQTAYKRQSKLIVMASITPGGENGNIYFNDGSRIRTTHIGGPQREEHVKERSAQFNVDMAKAQLEFQQSGTTEKDFKKWLQRRLVGVNVDNAPEWAKVIRYVQEANKQDPTGSEKLIEIFTKINGEYQGWHPSRGTGTRYETDKQTISVLQAAVKHIDGKYFKPVGVNKEDKDPEIAKRRKQLLQSLAKERKAPSEKNLTFLLQDPLIAEFVKRSKLKKPSIQQLDQDEEVRKRIDVIFGQVTESTLKNDQAIKDRMQVTQDTRAGRNKDFYEFVKSRLANSELVKAMRDPGSV